MTEIACQLNPQYDRQIASGEKPLAAITSLMDKAAVAQVSRFHHSISSLLPSPLIELKQLAHSLNLTRLWVKDESRRNELKAFKMLGASYAIGRYLHQLLQLPENALDFHAIRARQNEFQSVTFATATDGNHGRAVAWCAHQFGCQSQVFMPAGSSQNRLSAIQRYASHAEITDFNYDDTVSRVAQLAQQNGWVLIQDTAWPGYQDIPRDIMRGYFTLLVEFEQQAARGWPSHIFLQTGVGSMAAALAAYLVAHPNPTPQIILVEPERAPCFYQSMAINDGRPHRYSETMDTIMAGLACGEPSTLAWAILSRVASACVICADRVSLEGMQQYAKPTGTDPRIVSGESGAVTLGLLMAIMRQDDYAEIGQQLGLDASARVLLLSTEGDTDPQIYQAFLAGGAYGGS